MADKKEVSIKRVKPYPMSATLIVDGKPFKVAFVYLSVRGFIMHTPAQMLKVGQTVEVQFEIPVLHHMVRSLAKVSKTYDRAGDVSATTIERMAEGLFFNLDELHEKQINRFITAIGQRSA